METVFAKEKKTVEIMIEFSFCFHGTCYCFLLTTFTCEKKKRINFFNFNFEINFAGRIRKNTLSKIDFLFEKIF